MVKLTSVVLQKRDSISFNLMQVFRAVFLCPSLIIQWQWIIEASSVAAAVAAAESERFTLWL